MRSRNKNMGTKILVLLCLVSCARLTSATFFGMNWMKYFMQGMGGPAPPAVGFSGPETLDKPMIELNLPPNAPTAMEMRAGSPAGVPITVTNNGDEDVLLTFQVIETPGPDGESTGAIEVIGIRPVGGIPSKENPRQLLVPAGSTVEGEIGLVASGGSLRSGSVETAATITAQDASGRTQYLKDPIVITIVDDGSGSRNNLSTASQNLPNGQCIQLEEFLRTNGHTNTFAAVWEKAGLDQKIPATAEFSVLAPTDEAFEQLTSMIGITEEKLMESPSLDLLALHHVLPERLTPDEVAYLSSVKTATCSELEVGIQDSLVTMGGCTVSSSDVDVCGTELYTLNCVLPPPDAESQGGICLPKPTSGSSNGLQSGLGPQTGPRTYQGSTQQGGINYVDDFDDYDYGYDYDFELPPSLTNAPTSAVVSRGPSNQGGNNQGYNGQQRYPASASVTSNEYEPLRTTVLPSRIPDSWTRLHHLANAANEPVKATFLPPGWKEWITPGETSCRSGGSAPECSRVQTNGRTCADPNVLHTCGYLESDGPKSYQIQPPPGSFNDGFITMDDTYVWQSVEGGSSYCTPATNAGAAFKGAVYHEAWVEPRGSTNMDLMLFLLQNPLDGQPWQVVSMQTATLPGTNDVKRLKTLGQGCFLWVVASASGSGDYDFHLSVTERP